MKVEMKDSGIPWVGKCPANWEVLKGKQVLQLKKKPVRNDDEVITCFRDGEVVLRTERRTDGFTMSDKEIGYQGIDKGDIVIHGMDGFAGAIGISKSTGKGSPVLIICNPKKNDNSSYIVSYLRVLANTNVFLALATGIRERSCDLRWNKISELPIVLPPQNIQSKIVSFLDDKCADIDQLITLQQQMIDELKAYKQSVITEAVCKGLDKSVPMKDSGIEWIGEVPEGWIVAPLKNYVSCNDESLSENEDKNKIINYIEIGSVNNCGEIQNVQELIFSNAPSRARRKVNNNDVIISCVRTYLKSIAKITNEQDNYICSTGFAVLRPNNKINPDYLYYCLFSDVFTSKVEANSTGISYPAINTPKLLGLKIIVPARTEQSVIVSYLDEKTSQIDTLISIKQQKIDELKEYKKSMIYEYITGKKQVSNK